MVKKIILFSLGLISVLLFLLAPSGYSMNYVIYCSVVFFASSLIMLSSNCKQTWIKFEFFFLISFFFTNYVYPLIFYPINPYFSLFRISFNEDYISKGAALATVAITWFNLGIFEIKTIRIPKNDSFNIKKRLQIPRLVAFILFILFIPSLYVIYQSNTYSTEFESSYVNVILKYVVLYVIFAFIYNNRFYLFKTFIKLSLKSYIIIFTIVYTVLFLLIGSRTIPLNIVLFSLFLLNILIYKISKKKIAILTVGGALLLTGIGIARGGSSIEEGTVSSVWDVGTDLTINNRSLYVLMEEVDKHNVTFGATMMMNVLSVVPFAQSLYLNITGQPLSTISSANLVTDLHFGTGYNEERFGLGTNLVGDVYIAFGLIGVTILFWLFGYVLRCLYLNIGKGKTLALLIYALFFMSAIYYTRSGYLTPVRDVLWVLGVFWLSNTKLFKV